MFSTTDVIVAVATPPGRGGIGLVRVSGPETVAIVRSILQTQTDLHPRQATLTSVRSPATGVRVDRVLATYFPGPASYTGEEVVEISGHGTPVLLRQIVEAVVDAGARLAEPGEFTLRAFLNGRLDLVQAEAVGDLVNAVTPLQARAAFDQLEGTVTDAIGEIDTQLFDLTARLEASVDFPDEGYHFADPVAVASEIRVLLERTDALLADARRGRLIREGCQVVILGKPNVGKSTLFNRLLGAGRAIVTDVPGTTRDLLTEVVEFDGVPVTLVDTAGIRETEDTVESEGVSRARGALGVAAAVVLVLDRSRPLDAEDRELLRETRSTDRVLVVNKADLPACWHADDLAPLASDRPAVTISLRDDTDTEKLRRAIGDVLWSGEQLRDPPTLSNLRHIRLVEGARSALVRAVEAAEAAAPEELVLADLQEARVAFEEVTGKRTADDVLHRIFSQFCIGKYTVTAIRDEVRLRCPCNRSRSSRLRGGVRGGADGVPRRALHAFGRHGGPHAV
jgi:tRNA modification GTPase